MGTVYESICGCLLSTPEPSPCEQPTGEWASEHGRWQREWEQAVAEHHAYCCQEAHRDLYGQVDRCLVGEDETCPHMRERGG